MIRKTVKCAAVGLLTALISGCAGNDLRDPTFLALKANPPKTIPAQDLVKLRQGKTSCRTFSSRGSGPYQLCWFSSSQSAQLYFFKPPRSGDVYRGNKNFITSIKY